MLSQIHSGSSCGHRLRNQFSDKMFGGVVLKVFFTRNFMVLGSIQYLLRIKFYVPSNSELLKITVLWNFTTQKHAMIYALLCQGIITKKNFGGVVFVELFMRNNVVSSAWQYLFQKIFCVPSRTGGL